MLDTQMNVKSSSESSPAGPLSASKRHIVIVQYADYRAAVHRVAAGGPEVYAAQRYSLDHTCSLMRYGRVTVLALQSEAHDEVLSNGVRSVGLGWHGRSDNKQLYRTLSELGPTDIVVGSPLLGALVWAFKRGVRVLPIFADSFSKGNVRRGVFLKGVAAMLALPAFTVVGNHNVPASLDLVRIGVPASKVVPWDWPAQRTPADFPAKPHFGERRPVSVFFAGLVIEDKGVGDLIRAIAINKQQGLDVNVSVAGAGEIDAMKRVANEAGVAERVEFLGKVANNEVVRLMHAHDFVAVPSRHEYSEGLAMTIYEALCSRSPLLLSDHPMFKRALGKQPGVRMFKASDPAALAQLIRDLVASPKEYEAVSKASADAWQHIQVPLKFGEMVDAWVRGTREDLEKLTSHSVAKFPYYASGGNTSRLSS